MVSLEELAERDEVELETDDFGWRGEAFVRVDDGWVSIPSALPGERIRIHPESEIGRGRRLFAKLDEVVEPSNERVESHCSRVTICRGCQLRTASANLEERFKSDRIVELFEKFGAFERSELPEIERIGVSNERDAGYRWRSSLTYDAAEGALGLVSGATPGLVPMEACPALTPRARATVATVARVVQELEPRWPGPADGGRGLRGVKVFAGEPVTIVLTPGSVAAGVVDRLAPLVETLQAEASDLRIGVTTQDGVELFGAPPWYALPFTADGAALEAHIGAWTHATVEPAEALYHAMARWFETTGAGARHLDLGCGIGALSLLSSRAGLDATGIDHDRHAIASARRNAGSHELEATFVAADWEKGCRGLTLEGAAFDVATLNPMREPIGGRTLSYLAKMGISRLFYLGPSPEAAARDTASLCEMGWRLEGMSAIDLHPASYQVMVGVTLTR